MSKYLILIYDDEAAWAQATPEATARIHEAHTKFGANNAEKILGGNALQSVGTATALRTDGSGGFSVTDGPFVETKEALGGYYLVEAADLDEAIALARQVPVLGPTAGLEVRPILEFE
jgi:hypothetical protein